MGESFYSTELPFAPGVSIMCRVRGCAHTLRLLGRAPGMNLDSAAFLVSDLGRLLAFPNLSFLICKVRIRAFIHSFSRCLRESLFYPSNGTRNAEGRPTLVYLRYSKGLPWLEHRGPGSDCEEVERRGQNIKYEISIILFKSNGSWQDLIQFLYKTTL